MCAYKKCHHAHIFKGLKYEKIALKSCPGGKVYNVLS